MGEDMICVQLVDDHAVVREGLRGVLQCDPNLRVIVESASSKEGYADYLRHRPDVMVLDIAMPGESGLAMLGRLMKRDPDARVLVLSMYDDEVIAIRAMEVGARGFITKGASPEMITSAVSAVGAGKTFIEDRIARKMALHRISRGRGVDDLTRREFEIFRMLASGNSVKDIADDLNLSPKTVGTHRTRIMVKLGCRNVAELVRLAIHCGVIRL